MYLMPNLWKKITCLTWQQTFLFCTAVFLTVHHRCDFSSELKFTININSVCAQALRLETGYGVTVTHSRADINTWQLETVGEYWVTGLQNKNESHQLHKLKNDEVWREQARFRKSVTYVAGFKRLWNLFSYLHLPINNCGVVGICSEVQEEPPLECQFFHSFLERI